MNGPANNAAPQCSAGVGDGSACVTAAPTTAPKMPSPRQDKHNQQTNNTDKQKRHPQVSSSSSSAAEAELPSSSSSSDNKTTDSNQLQQQQQTLTTAGGEGDATTNDESGVKQFSDKSLQELARSYLELPKAQIPDTGFVVSGIAGRFPNADNMNELWDNLLNGHDMVQGPDDKRWPLGKCLIFFRFSCAIYCFVLRELVCFSMLIL